MISRKNKFIFVHIPKTGGTSIEGALRRHGKVLQGARNFGSIYYKHATASGLQEMLGHSKYATYFKFSIVRNPWDWIVSQYAFCRGFAPPYVFGTPYGICGSVKPEHWDWSFSDWLPWWIEKLSPSQAMMLVDGEGQLIVDFVGRFERLESDFSKLCSILKLPQVPLPRLKSSERGPTHEYYDEKTRQLVIEHFKTDFELFGYSTQPDFAPTEIRPTKVQGEGDR